jgi:Glu-tRNA(Gln) amidotransferase subunit E-like FAD-binding protein
VMKNVMARFNGAGMRVDGKVVSEIVKQELAGK